MPFAGSETWKSSFAERKTGGVAPWGPSFQWNDGALRLHTFATVLGLMLVSLAKLALRTESPAKTMMTSLAAIRATEVRALGGKRRPPTLLVPPTLDAEQRCAVQIFALDRWMPSLSSSSKVRRPAPDG